jgi:hypothetical protein
MILGEFPANHAAKAAIAREADFCLTRVVVVGNKLVVDEPALLIADRPPVRRHPSDTGSF